MQKINTTGKNIYINIMIIVIGIAVVFDFVQEPYFNVWLKDFFDYDYSVTITIGLALWAFTTSLVTLFISKQDECYMGITYSEYYDIKRRKSGGAIEKSIIVIVVIMILSTFLKFPITLFTCVIVQLLIMISTFCMIKNSLSNEVIDRMISVDFAEYIIRNRQVFEESNLLKESRKIYGNEEILISKIIKVVDLTNINNQEKLIKILRESNLHNHDRKASFAVGRLVTDNLLNASLTLTNKYKIIGAWFCCKECTLEIKEGIIYALTETINTASKEFIKMLFLYRDREGAKEEVERLVIWHISVCIFLMRFPSFEERRIYIPELKQYYLDNIKYFPNTELREKIQEQWCYLCVIADCNPMEGIDILYQVIGSK